MRLLPCALVALVSVALLPLLPGQAAKKPKKPVDWDSVVKKAHEGRRIMLRRAAARKVASAGDPAIPSVRRFEQAEGRNAISLALVSSYASAASKGPDTLTLLGEWAQDRTFYWRAQALEALANRRLPGFIPLFRVRLTDPSYLTRIQAARGLLRLGKHRDEARRLLRDPDPRARMRVAVCMVEEGDDLGLPTLIEALRQDASFMDYPWGALGSRVAIGTLRKLAGSDFGYRPGTPLKENEAAIAKLEAFAKKRLGERWVDPIPAVHDSTAYRAGIAIRSCRLGDLFIRLTDDRRVVFGLEGKTSVPLSPAEWERCWTTPPATGTGIRGKVVCDYLRIMCKNPAADEKFAPDNLAKISHEWLEVLAGTLENKNRAGLARQIRSRLQQFASSR